MSFTRIIFGLPGAAIVTVGLFILMGAMIRQDAEPTLDTRESKNIVLGRTIEETKTVDQVVDGRPKDLPTPPDSVIIPEGTGKPGDINIDLPNAEPTNTTDRGTFAIGRTPTDIMIAPSFPERCAQLGVEGVVVVEFDVTPEGLPVNVRVVETPNNCFNRAAITAIERSRFSPDMSDGRPAMRRGERRAIRFQLED